MQDANNNDNNDIHNEYVYETIWTSNASKRPMVTSSSFVAVEVNLEKRVLRITDMLKSTSVQKLRLSDRLQKFLLLS